MVLLIICGIVLLLSVYTLIRNEKVFNYRMDLLRRIHDQSLAGFENNVYEWQWRYDEMNAVTYGQMLYTPKSLDKFYPRDPARSER